MIPEYSNIRTVTRLNNIVSTFQPSAAPLRRARRRGHL